MCARAATALAPSGKKARYTRLSRCAGWSHVHTLKGLRTTEEASLVRCKTVVPRAGLVLAHGRLVCACALTRALHRARSLWGGGAARALVTRARRTTLSAVGPYPRKGHCTSENAFFSGAMPCSDVPGAVSDEQPACACVQTRSRHRARSVWGGGAARALAARARRAALDVVGPRPMKGHCTSERPLSFGARP